MNTGKETGDFTSMKRKVCIVSGHRFIQSSGGVERVLVNLANELYVRGHKVSLLCAQNKEGSPFYPLEPGVEFYNTKYNRTAEVFQRIRSIFIYNKERRQLRKHTRVSRIKCQRIAEYIKKENPDIIIVSTPLVSYVLKETYHIKIPIITMIHGNPVNVLGEYTEDILRKYIDYVQVLTPNYVEDAKAILGNGDVTYIPNMVPLTNKTTDYSKKVILTVARIEKDKRILFLIQAFQRISKQYPEWKLEIWGDYRLNRRYYKLCRDEVSKYRLQKQVKFCGTTNDIFSTLQGGSIFAFPSNSEGFPLAFTEAMSIGLPPVGISTCSGVNEIVESDYNGILTEDNIISFAQALEKLINDEKIRRKLGEQAKNSMKEYAPDIVWTQWEDLIERVLKKESTGY